MALTGTVYHVDLTHGKPYTVLALGKLANIKAQLLPDTSKAPPTSPDSFRSRSPTFWDACSSVHDKSCLFVR